MSNQDYQNIELMSPPDNIEEYNRFPVVYVSEHSGEESFCGIDDSQEVEKYNGQLGVSKEFVDKHQKNVGQIQWKDKLKDKYSNPGNVSGQRWASGILISNDMFLTAGHCFDPTPDGWTVPRIQNSNNPISPKEIARNMKINFNYQYDTSGTPRIEDSYDILELVEYREGNLDYAIVKLDGSPGEKYGYAKLSNIDAKINDMVCIIQHPDGLPKRVEAGPVTFLESDERIGYGSLDTRGGSSGAGIIQYETGKIVGVHTNGGCDDPSKKFNYGVRVSSLLAVSPTIKGSLADNM